VADREQVFDQNPVGAGLVRSGVPGSAGGAGITARDAPAPLGEQFLFRGTPDYIRSDNGPEFTTKTVRKWLSRLSV
jgi:hypothetical protein